MGSAAEAETSAAAESAAAAETVFAAETSAAAETSSTSAAAETTAPAEPQEEVPSAVVLSAQALTLEAGKQSTLRAQVMPETVSQEVTWTSSDAGIASVDQSGTVRGIAIGTATVTAVTADGTVQGSCTVTITPISVSSVKLSAGAFTLYAGGPAARGQGALTASVTPANAADKKLTWSSSNPSVVRVDQNGKLTAVKAGTAQITAAAANPKVRAVCKVTVKQWVRAKSLTLSKTKMYMWCDSPYTLKVTRSPSNAMGNIRWSSSNTRVATVDANGHVWACGGGTTTITAVSEDGAARATCLLIVAFRDMRTAAKWKQTAALWGTERGITSGTSQKNFAPDQSCTREQIMTFLYNRAGRPKVSGSLPFTDVRRGTYYYNAVLWGVQKGVTSGVTKTAFGVGRSCTRAEIVAFLYRLRGNPRYKRKGRFSDVTSDWQKKPTEWAWALGIASGVGGGRFAPNQSCTRAQAMQFLRNDALAPNVAQPAAGRMTLTVMDYGRSFTDMYGDSVLLQSQGRNLLMDSCMKDPQQAIRNYLKAHGVKKLTLYVSHYHNDHEGEMPSIILDRYFTIDRIYLPDPLKLGTYASKANKKQSWYKDAVKYWKEYQAVLSAARQRNVPITYLTTGSSFSVGDAKFNVLYQGRNLTPYQFSEWGAGNYMNNVSLVTMIHCGDIRVLTAGDIQFTTERTLCATGMNFKADIMKLSHHGWGATSNSEAFLKRVNPDLVWWENEQDTPQRYHRDIYKQLNRLHSGARGLSVRYNGTFRIVVDDGNYDWFVTRNPIYRRP